MKFAGIEMRFNQPRERIVFHAHEATCPHCEGVVKMRGNIREPFQPFFDQCWCLLCGQPYEADLQGLTIEQWTEQQWQQKAERG